MSKLLRSIFIGIGFALTVALNLSCAKDEASDSAREKRSVHVAVAANFAAPMKQIANRFEAETGSRVMISTGSTGKLYAQIINGAPFDIFLAADEVRPKRLESEGHAISGTRFTYARGNLILALAKPSEPRAQARGHSSTNASNLRDVLTQTDFDHLAIANPDLAPYGRAAKETLIALELWEPIEPKLVLGENIAQTYQFLQSGAADLAFVAAAQMAGTPESEIGDHWEVPQTLHAPIDQQAILLTDTLTARELLAYLRSDAAMDIIRGFGYDLP